MGQYKYSIVFVDAYRCLMKLNQTREQSAGLIPLIYSSFLTLLKLCCEVFVQAGNMPNSGTVLSNWVSTAYGVGGCC